jgi:hypothetical protein
MNVISCLIQSFWAPPLGGEPGIHNPRSVIMDSGFAQERAPE